MPSQRRLHTIGNDSGRNVSGNRAEIGVVEIDTTFARTLGLIEGQKVSIQLLSLIF